jgi:beta-glucosidase
VDLALVERVGQALGVESAIEDVAVILGPGINIKRSPLCGRNFEYFSEDPIVSGAFGAALVTGIQSQGVGSSLKHFAANNQEHDRMRVSSDVDARPLREIYLRGFERVVRDAQPWTVMCAYNKINGVYASEDPWLLTQVLRDDWGFEGLVVSDWGAVNDRVVGLPAGLDLEMPSSGGRTDAQLVAAVQDGTLDEQALDAAANRVLDLVTKAQARPAPTGPLDVDAHHALAREAAGRAIVLLRNEGAILPLRRDAKLAVIGEFARTPRYQGAGSSLINPTRLDTALDELRALSAGEVVFARVSRSRASPRQRTARPRSSSPKPWPRHPPPTSQCCSSAFPPPTSRRASIATTSTCPRGSSRCWRRCAQRTRTSSSCSNGSVVALPFRDDVPAIVEAWLLGQAGGGATADVLFGIVNPSGKLTETIPLRLEDNPSWQLPG